MPAPLAAAEDAFMADLFADLDASIFDMPLSPDVRTSKAKHSSQKQAVLSSPLASAKRAQAVLVDRAQAVKAEPGADSARVKPAAAAAPVPSPAPPARLSQQPPKNAQPARAPPVASSSSLKSSQGVVRRGAALPMSSPFARGATGSGSSNMVGHAQGKGKEVERTVAAVPETLSAEEVAAAAEERQHWRNFVRARVLAVRPHEYFPPTTRPTPSAASINNPSTVRRIMARPEVVLELEEMGRVRLDAGSSEVAKESNHGTRRKCTLRDEWVATAQRTQVGDIVHLVGRWGQAQDDWVPAPAPAKVKSGASAALAIEIDEDADLWEHQDEPEEEDEDASFWAELDEPPLALIPSMLLSSSSEPDAQGIVPADNLLILNPDVLLSATAISGVSSCTRKPLLQARLRSSAADDGGSEAILMGKMLHEVLQACLTGIAISTSVAAGEADASSALEGFPETWTHQPPTNFAASFVRAQIKAQVFNSLEDLVGADMDVRTAEERLAEAAKSFASFATTFLAQPAGDIAPDATAIDARCKEPPRLRIKRVLGVEEDIWSPMYGMKGFVDVSVEVEIMDVDEQEAAGARRSMSTHDARPAASAISRRAFSTTKLLAAAPPSRTRTSIMPLELKTGKAFGMLEHRAQTMLYQLMMSDRYGAPCDEGLLYYSRTGELHRVRKVRNEVRGLLIGRNELASYLVKRDGAEDKEAEAEETKSEDVLPPTIDSERACARCFAVEGCMLYRRAVDDVVEDPENPTAIAELYERKTGHWTDEHAHFFKTWERLLTLEEEDTVRFRRELWTMTAAARQSVGRALADMQLVEEPSQAGTLPVGRRRYQFVRRPVAGQDEAPFTTHLIVGDRVTVSVEPMLPALISGTVIEMTASRLTLSAERDLRPAFRRAAEEAAPEQLPVFRIDRDEFTGGMSRIRQNLARLFLAGAAGDVVRRELVVDLRAPRFRPSEEVGNVTLPAHLNDDQCDAVRHVLAAEDYALVVGMPGTGKTTTITELIRLLVGRGKSVLLASYTHSAVDTICRKLVGGEGGVDLLRLGQTDKIHPDVRGCALKPSCTTEELEARLITPNVVATTCLSVGHTLFAKRRFDYCIVDEASQITLPTCLGPLRFAGVFVLVGDPLQLPPLVRNQRARDGGLDVSLFSRLAQAHPDSQVYLTRQYRMNRDIMRLSNELVYGGKLQCGSEEVADLSLVLPMREAALAKMHAAHGTPSAKAASCDAQQCWLDAALDHACRVVFLDTDLVPGAESRVHGDLVQNEVEASLIAQLSSAMILGGASPADIAIITPLRQQIKLLTSTLHPNVSPAGSIEILTADRAQGRDKAVVLLSLVRSNASSEAGRGNVGELLNDARRINVAFTRAQRKLVIVGSRKTLKEAPLLVELFELMAKHNWIRSLPAGAASTHRPPPGRWAAVASAHSTPEQHTHKKRKEAPASSGAPATPSRRSVSASSASKASLTKAARLELDVEMDLDVPVPAQRSKTSHTAGAKAVLHGRPFLRDVVNEVGEEPDFS